MANVVIYYNCEQGESTEQAVLRVNELIQFLETHHIIKGVFLDIYNEGTELMELLNSPLSEIDMIYINKDIDNEFDKALIIQLSRAEQFEIKYIDKI
ncbi:hypothetical protein [Cytobacillus sp. NCCP-133]|uniref:hypothetical protein n=1 Tax=Cytobacillus sp. NCCP-133 TaxID=766848 RepID=UPI002231A38B|nr:hypothetical protein [Cytobacillus sp. NCCP-133]GLB58646.1 hypothetical protein NCCP133_07790 [Cytobacillus sp. NCCP-133]